MDHRQFDHIARSLSAFQSRRGLLGALGMSAIVLPGAAEAKKKHKHKKKKKKAQLNEFGCVNVGGFCQDNTQCCSGRCEGTKGKKLCIAHDSGTCQGGQSACDDAEGVSCVSSTGAKTGACDTTTGNAPYCSAPGGSCFSCAKDSDCVPFCGAQAACTRCAVCADEGVVTACVGPTADACTFPA
jgi:hypothetical protein